MRLYLIRHAESANNAIYSDNGDGEGRSPDPEITTKGHQQASLLGVQLAHPHGEMRQHPYDLVEDFRFGVTHLYCSLMTRSLLTAGYIADAIGVQAEALPDIFEWGGIFELDENGYPEGLPGPNRAYFEERFPDVKLPESLGEAGWYNRPYETEAMFVERVSQLVTEFKSHYLHTDICVAMVVHGDLIDQFINELVGLKRNPTAYQSPWGGMWSSHNASISRIDFKGDGPTLIYFNRIDHLPADLVTW